MNPIDMSARRAAPLPARLKDSLRRHSMVQSLWMSYRRRQLVAEYRAHREHYAAIAAERKLVYSEASTRALVHERLAARGYTPARRKPGEVHTFAVFSSYGWHKQLLPDLHELGPMTHFDYEAIGYSAEEFARCDGASMLRRNEMNDRILPSLREAHSRRPVDWGFFYGGGHEYTPAVVQRITEELGIPVANMSLDDKQGWARATPSGARAGAIDITSSFDLFATSARVVCGWHLVEGGRPIYLPEGFNASAYAPRDTSGDLPVSFVGAAYGFRRAVIEFLRGHGIPITPFGAGWPEGRTADVVEVFNRSIVNLGMGGIEYSEELTNVKGRDFEVPGTGGGLYLTTFNPDLAQHFVIGEEIVCYHNRDEMLELIRYYLAHPDEAAAIARRGRDRSLREHRWLHRYTKMLDLLGILTP